MSVALPLTRTQATVIRLRQGYGVINRPPLQKDSATATRCDVLTGDASNLCTTFEFRPASTDAGSVINPDDIIERVPPLEAVTVCRAAFLKRVPGVDVTTDKLQALNLLEAVHRDARRQLGLADWPLVTAEQVHGNQIAVIDGPIEQDRNLSGYDGFITNQQRVALGIYVADCCAVYIVDPKTPAVGLVHSGKRGTQLGIAANVIQQMQRRFGSNAGELIVYLSPCIRLPHYEVDFAAQIRDQCHSAGVERIHDSGVCTACDLKSYYSYRAEKGKTGRMLALLGLV